MPRSVSRLRLKKPCTLKKKKDIHCKDFLANLIPPTIDDCFCGRDDRLPNEAPFAMWNVDVCVSPLWRTGVVGRDWKWLLKILNRLM